MLVTNVKQLLSIKTEYNEKYYLIQLFKGLNYQSFFCNTPIDFVLSGFALKDEIDDFRPSKIISFCTDECTPTNTNGCFIGANHGLIWGINIESVNHGLDYSYIGTTLTDENGTKFTVLHIIDKNNFVVLSENKGESEETYKFVSKTTGKLKSDFSNKEIENYNQSSTELKANRTIEKSIIVYNGKQAKKLSPSQIFTIDCDYVELVDRYIIVNYASIINEIAKNRPKNGYKANFDITELGKGMIEMNITYRILSDGTVLSIFDNKALVDVKWKEYLGAMCQLKENYMGGKTYRYIPNVLPFEVDGIKYDFAKGVDLQGDYPQSFEAKKEYYGKYIPNRTLDVFNDLKGKNSLGFSIGFLPVYDGEFEKRKQNNQYCYYFYRSKKNYPVFISGEKISGAKGVAFKKYYDFVKDGVSKFIIDFDGKRYTYIDLLKKSNTEIQVNDDYKIIEQAGDIAYKKEGNRIMVSGLGSLVIEE